MSRSQDPFDEGKAEATTLLQQAEAATRKLTVSVDRGTATPAIASQCADAVDAAADEVSLLRSVVDALKSGKARRSGIGHSELSAREDFVEESERRIADMRSELDRCGSIALAAVPPAAAATSQHARRPVDDDAPEAHALDIEDMEEMQQVHRQQQDKALDRIHAGMDQLQHKAALIGNTLDEETDELEALHEDTDALTSKLAHNMRRVDKLLDEMSSRSKCYLVACLAVTVFILFIMLVFM